MIRPRHEPTVPYVPCSEHCGASAEAAALLQGADAGKRINDALFESDYRA